MPVYLYKGRFIIAILFAAILLLFASCKKSITQDNPLVQAYFNTNILNRNFIIQFASDSSVDITSVYTKDTFLLKNDSSSMYEGSMTASKDGIIYTGTWDSNSDYSKLDINITTPTTPSEFVFLNRSWRFTKKDIPVLQLAPWGSTDPKVLYMQRL
jgi:hypothetical protein